MKFKNIQIINGKNSISNVTVGGDKNFQYLGSYKIHTDAKHIMLSLKNNVLTIYINAEEFTVEYLK
jgi:hypothetical protein